MNGIALLMIAATLGVEYDWRTTDDGQIEYVLIVEPDFITALAEGSEIRSSVPPELESVQRLCIRIAPAANAPAGAQNSATRKLPANSFATGGVRGATDPPTILWKANGQPEQNFNVRYGWQPTKEGQLEYFVQVDPKLLRTLVPGDEIYTLLSTEAGRVDTFVVFSNTKQLPKVPGRPAAAPLAGNNFAASDLSKPRPGVGAPPLGPAPSNLAGSTAPFSPTFGAGATTSPSPAPLAPAPTSPWSTTPTTPASTGFNSPATGLGSSTTNPPRPFGGTSGSVFDRDNSRVNPAAGYEPAQTPPPNNNGYQNESTTRPDLNRPNLGGTQPPAGGYGNETRNPYLQENGLRGSNLNPPALNNDPYGTNDPYRRDLNPPAAQRNDAFPNNNNFAGNNYANTPTNPAYRPNDQLAPGGNVPYRPGVGSPQGNQNLAGRGYGDPNLTSAQSVNFPPNNADNQMASLPNNGNLFTPLSTQRVDASGKPLPVVEAEKPWWPLLFTVIILFFSIGANLYLGWTAAEFYSRYRLAVERLRSSGGRG